MISTMGPRVMWTVPALVTSGIALIDPSTTPTMSAHHLVYSTMRCQCWPIHNWLLHNKSSNGIRDGLQVPIGDMGHIDSV